MQVRSAIIRRWHRRIGSRSRGRWLAVSAAASAAIAVMGLLVPAGAASAAGTPNVTIFLTYAPTKCADVHNYDNNAGGIVDIYPCASAKNDHWLYVGGVNCTGSINEPICTEFIDAKNTSVCLSMNGARNVVLQNCGTNGNLPPAGSLWLVDTGAENGWRNLAWGANGDMAVANTTTNNPLYGVDASAPCGCWFRWSVS